MPGVRRNGHCMSCTCKACFELVREDADKFLGREIMQGRFNGRVPVSTELQDGSVVVNGREVSLRALNALTPEMLALLEEMVKPEASGSVYRVEHGTKGVQVTKIGLASHAARVLTRGRAVEWPVRSSR